MLSPISEGEHILNQLPRVLSPISEGGEHILSLYLREENIYLGRPISEGGEQGYTQYLREENIYLREENIY